MDENPLSCGGINPMHYIGIGTGLSYSNVLPNDKTIKKSFLKDRYFINYERFLDNRDMMFSDPSYSIEVGLIYSKKKFELNKSNSSLLNVELEFLNVPITFNYVLHDSRNHQKFDQNITYKLILMAGVYSSFLLSQETSKLNDSQNELNISYPNIDYGLQFGTRIEFETFNVFSPFPIYLEYNFQYGLVNLKEIFPNSYNLTHSLSLGIKLPTTSF